jgi:DNA-binding CsgD family transcriptional regulator
MESESQVIELLGKISDDLHSIRLLMTRLSRDSFAKDLEAVASTSERQEMWRLADGSRNTEEIAKGAGASIRSVQYFLQDAEKRGLILYIKRGYPKRADYFDEIPSTWKPFKKQQAQSALSAGPQSQGEMTHEQQ